MPLKQRVHLNSSLSWFIHSCKALFVQAISILCMKLPRLALKNKRASILEDCLTLN